MAWTLRPACAADDGFLQALYADTRRDEFAAAGLALARIDLLLWMQCEVRERQYRQRYPQASFDILQCEGRDVGRCVVDRADDFHLVDIALLRTHRGLGLGTAVLRALLAEADAAQRSVRLHVEASSPARRWYERLGFEADGPAEVYLPMRRAPQGTAAADALARAA